MAGWKEAASLEVGREEGWKKRKNKFIEQEIYKLIKEI